MKVGDWVSIKRQANTRVQIVAINGNRATLRTSFGTKAGERSLSDLVPYGESVGKSDDVRPTHKPMRKGEVPWTHYGRR